MSSPAFIFDRQSANVVHFTPPAVIVAIAAAMAVGSFDPVEAAAECEGRLAQSYAWLRYRIGSDASAVIIRSSGIAPSGGGEDRDTVAPGRVVEESARRGLGSNMPSSPSIVCSA